MLAGAGILSHKNLFVESGDIFNTRECPVCGYGLVLHVRKGVVFLRCLNPECGFEGDLI